jgi:hypothetical protein
VLFVNPAAGGKIGSGPDLADDPALLEPEALADALRARLLSVTLRVLTETDDVRALGGRGAQAGWVGVVGGGDGTYQGYVLDVAPSSS